MYILQATLQALTTISVSVAHWSKSSATGLESIETTVSGTSSASFGAAASAGSQSRSSGASGSGAAGFSSRSSDGDEKMAPTAGNSADASSSELHESIPLTHRNVQELFAAVLRLFTSTHPHRFTFFRSAQGMIVYSAFSCDVTMAQQMFVLLVRRILVRSRGDRAIFLLRHASPISTGIPLPASHVHQQGITRCVCAR